MLIVRLKPKHRPEPCFLTPGRRSSQTARALHTFGDLPVSHGLRADVVLTHVVRPRACLKAAARYCRESRYCQGARAASLLHRRSRRSTYGVPSYLCEKACAAINVCVMCPGGHFSRRRYGRLLAGSAKGGRVRQVLLAKTGRTDTPNEVLPRSAARIY